MIRRRAFPFPVCRPRRNAFTLLELLIVIAVLSLLTAILLPSLQQAKELARESLCLSSMRNIGTLLQYYAQDNRNRFPVPYDPGLLRNAYYCWATALGPYLTQDPARIRNDRPMCTTPDPATSQPEDVVRNFQCLTVLAEHPTTWSTRVMNNYGFLTDPNCFYMGLNLEAVADASRRIAVGEGAYYVRGGASGFDVKFLVSNELGFYHRSGNVTGTWSWLGAQYEQTDGRGTLLLVDAHAVSAAAKEISPTPETGPGPYFTVPY